MATSPNRRDVTLGIGVETTGEPKLTDLAAAVRDVGAAGKDAAVGAEALGRELEALARVTAEKRSAESAARADVLATRKALDDQRTALERLRAESDKATRGTAEFADRERALKLAVIDGRQALRDKQAALTAAADASRTAAVAEATFEQQIKRTAAATREQASSSVAASKAVTDLRGSLDTLRNVALAATGGTLIGSLARDLGETADSVANLRARLQLVVGDGPVLEAAYQGVLDVAQRTGAALETTGTLFARIVQSGKEFGLTQRDALALTEAINEAVAVSGTSAQASDAALTQLIQGLQSGVLRGEEFNSIMEQAPRLARALADGLAVTTGELRKMAAAGALTTDVVIGALQGQAETLRREYETLPPTIGRALQSLSTAWSDFVGDVDRATSTSTTAAAAIKALADNLDTVAGVLFGLGKAAAAYQALKFAGTLLEAATAARAVTVATTAATAATVANTAATVANAAAQGASVAAAGRLAGILSMIKGFTFLAVVTNLKEIGTAIGENIAKWRGADKALLDLERTQRADEAASRANAAAKAALAQATQQATDRALGLTKESKALITEFDGVITKGESVADALTKIGKALDLSDVRGIAIAGTALDALAVRGKITADQLRETLGGALKGIDLGVFEAQARAAFDGTEQGARRLAAALDALAGESLRRVGTSARELETGFSAAARSAINDVDALAAALAALGDSTEDTGRALATGLDKATAAASTERAVRAVIERIQELGRTGQLAGDLLTASLEKARAKLDELRPGVNSLSEALRAFGLKTREELQGTAEKLGAAYRVLANDVTISLADKAAAFAKYAEAAIRANGGIESSEVRLQRQILQNRLEAAGLGDTLTDSMRRAGKATDEATAAQRRLGAAMASVSATAGRIGTGGVQPGDVRDENGRTAAELERLREQGGPVDASYNFQIRDRLAKGDSFTAEDIPTLQNALRAMQENINASVRGTGGFYDTATRRDDNMWLVLFQRALEKAQGAALLPRPGVPPPAPSGATGGAQGLAVNVFIGNQRRTVNVASQSDADALIKALEEAAGT